MDQTVTSSIYDSPQWSWLKLVVGLQKVLLLAWFASVCLLHSNVYMLVALVVLLPLWGLAVLIGGWHLVKRTGQYALALQALLAFPIVYLTMSLLQSWFGLPLLRGDSATWLLYALIAAFPLYALGRWLLRATASSPAASDITPQATHRVTPTDVLILGIAVTVLCQLLFLLILFALNEPTDSIFTAFGSNWYEPTLNITAVLASLTALVGVPYALFGLVRRTRRASMMLTILACIGVLALVGIGFFVVLASLVVG